MAPVSDKLLLVTLRRGTVWKMPCRGLTSPLPHYLIVLNLAPRSDEVLVMSVVTSNIAHRRELARITRNPPETIVEFGPGEYAMLDHPSCVDCNSLVTMAAVEFQQIARSRSATPCDDIPQEVLERILAGVQASVSVPANIKKLVGG